MSHRVPQTMPLLIWEPSCTHSSAWPSLVSQSFSITLTKEHPTPLSGHWSAEVQEAIAWRHSAVYTSSYTSSCACMTLCQYIWEESMGVGNPEECVPGMWYLIICQVSKHRNHIQGNSAGFNKQLNSEFCCPLPQYNPINILKQVTDLPISVLYTTSPLLPSLCLPFQLRTPQICVVLLITLTHVFNSLNFFL